MIGYGLDGKLLVQVGIVEFMMLPALVISQTLAAVLCFKRYGRLRYSLWLLVTTFGTCLMAMTCFDIIMLIPMGRDSFSIDAAMEMMSQMLVAGLSLAAFLYAIQLVFLLFTLSTPFYRERFCKCNGLGPADVGMSGPDSPLRSKPSPLPEEQSGQDLCKSRYWKKDGA
jgi:hypothetical protein